MLLDLLKEQNLVKFYNNKLFENRIKIQEITFRNWDNLLYFFEGDFFFYAYDYRCSCSKKTFSLVRNLDFTFTNFN